MTRLLGVDLLKKIGKKKGKSQLMRQFVLNQSVQESTEERTC